jgi:diaminopimelate epimerase
MRKVNAYESAILDVFNSVEMCANPARSAVKYVSEKEVVKATRRGKPSKRACQTQVLLTIGRPNYAERKFIKLCQKAGEPFPVKKVQLKLYPAKKVTSKK